MIRKRLRFSFFDQAINIFNDVFRAGCVQSAVTVYDIIKNHVLAKQLYDLPAAQFMGGFVNFHAVNQKFGNIGHQASSG
jgi:hypothetical protein